MIKKQILILFILILILSTIAYAWTANKQVFMLTTKQTNIHNQIGFTPQKDYTSVNNYSLFNGAIPRNKIIPAREPVIVSLDMCFETDNGLDYFNRGTTYFLPRPSSYCQTEVAGALEQCRIMPIGNCLQYIPEECRPRAESDYCANSTLLHETYCGIFGIRSTNHRCEYGCYNGACV